MDDLALIRDHVFDLREPGLIDMARLSREIAACDAIHILEDQPDGQAPLALVVRPNPAPDDPVELCVVRVANTLQAVIAATMKQVGGASDRFPDPPDYQQALTWALSGNARVREDAIAFVLVLNGGLLAQPPEDLDWLL